ncbi:MAG: UDP-2,3-diacylglucosamine diphosphatase [Bacteroidia bacterium]
MLKDKIYFISDFHLGAPCYEKSLGREKKIVRWLETVRKDAAEIYILGDVFDFWFEYKHAIPKGFIRLQGKLAELADEGIKLHYFTGNHDMWVFDYLPEEIGMTLYCKPVQREINGKRFFIGHGDALGPGDHGYKFIKKVFANKFCQWLFARLHPNLGIGMAKYWSRKSRISTDTYDEKYLGDDKEYLVVFAKEILKKEHFDYFIFGHRHLALDVKVGENSRYVNLGDWIRYFTYAVFDGKDLELKKFE